MTSANTYKVIELVGTSPESVEKAIENAIGRARQTLQGLDWFEVKEIRGYIKEDQVG
jgi:flavin-binding protein dodecin